MAEQLADQGWVSVLIDPESELRSPLRRRRPPPGRLARPSQCPHQARSSSSAQKMRPSSSPMGRVILEAAEEHRKPVFVVIDEGQLFSTSSRRKSGDVGEAADIINQFAGRGRKRALDLFHHRFALHRHAAASAFRKQEPDADRMPGRSHGMVGARPAIQGFADRIFRPKRISNRRIFLLQQGWGREKSACRWQRR